MQKAYGNWIFDEASFELRHKPTGYFIDLDSVTSTGEMLDWIMQIAKKTSKHYSNADLGALCRAFSDLLDAQVEYCCWGKSVAALDPRKLYEKVRTKGYDTVGRQVQRDGYIDGSNHEPLKLVDAADLLK